MGVCLVRLIKLDHIWDWIGLEQVVDGPETVL